jgi:hypothetical protein
MGGIVPAVTYEGITADLVLGSRSKRKKMA